MAEFFPDVPKIAYGGPKSRNPLEFKHYNPDEVVGGKTMKEHCGSRSSTGTRSATRCPTRSAPARPSGPGTTAADSVANAQQQGQGRVRVHREARRPVLRLPRPRRRPRGRDAQGEPRQPRRGRQGPQGRAGSAPASSCSGAPPTCSATRATCTARPPARNFDVFAFAAAQVKKALEVTHELGGEGYTFWGGREGYSTLLEHRHEARARPPRPRSSTWPSTTRSRSASPASSTSSPSRRSRPSTSTTPTPRPASTSCGPTTCCRTSSSTSRPTTPRSPATRCSTSWKSPAAPGALGSIDANTGDLLLGWDTDQFPTDIYLTTQCMLCILEHGRLHHRRRQLRRQGPPRELRADRPVPRPHRRHGRLRPRPQDRPRDHRRRPARRVRQGALRELGLRARPPGRVAARPASPTSRPTSCPRATPPTNASGRQEMLENLINEFI